MCQSKLKTLAGINALNNRHAKKEEKVKKRVDLIATISNFTTKIHIFNNKSLLHT